MLLRMLCLLCSIAILNACALQSAAKRLAERAEKYQLVPIEIYTHKHRLLAYGSSELKNTRNLHVYLEGDGTPWINGKFPATDPTGTTALALDLMALDPQPRVYLNRPCYGFDKMAVNCYEALWTSDRYSSEVLESLAEALDWLRQSYGIESFTLIGYSGGASLAVLLASQREDVSRLVTIAGNLDHENWTQHFGYDPLLGSLNPADAFPLSINIERWHLIGTQDTVIPAQITLDAAKRDSGAEIIQFEEFDHYCCWRRRWESLLEEIF